MAKYLSDEKCRFSASSGAQKFLPIYDVFCKKIDSSIFYLFVVVEFRVSVLAENVAKYLILGIIKIDFIGFGDGRRESEKKYIIPFLCSIRYRTFVNIAHVYVIFYNITYCYVMSTILGAKHGIKLKSVFVHFSDFRLFYFG